MLFYCAVPYERTRRSMCLVQMEVGMQTVRFGFEIDRRYSFRSHQRQAISLVDIVLSRQERSSHSRKLRHDLRCLSRPNIKCSFVHCESREAGCFNLNHILDAIAGD